MSALASTPGRLGKDRRAVTTVEYAVMLAVVSAIAAIAVTGLSPVLASMISVLPGLLS